MSEDAREIAQRIVREVLAAHEAADDALHQGQEATSAPAAEPAPAEPGVPGGLGPHVGDPAAVPDALEDSPARQAAKRIVAEVLAAHAEASRSLAEDLPVVAEAEEPGPAPATPVLQPVPGRPAVVPAEPSPAAPAAEADVAEDAATIARRIVASVLAQHGAEGPPPIPVDVRRPVTIEDEPLPRLVDDEEPAAERPAAEAAAADGGSAARDDDPDDGEVWVLADDEVAEDPGAAPHAARGSTAHAADTLDEPLFATDDEPTPVDDPVEPIPRLQPSTAASAGAAEPAPGGDDAAARDADATRPLAPSWLDLEPEPDGGEVDHEADTGARHDVGQATDTAAGDTPEDGDDEAGEGDVPTADATAWRSTDEDDVDRTARVPVATLERDDDTVADGTSEPTVAIPTSEPTVAIPAAQPPRRTGRWLIASILGAVALAVLLPLAVAALRSLVALS
ncbi:hypothetical protein [Egicoccus sp. AB-alg2]|uniref:hypothetical protein n=1 Tax=Egicoccus sp. AB-alg2 TaxID=3242693 RepID=UPI00359DA4AA